MFLLDKNQKTIGTYEKEIKPLKPGEKTMVDIEIQESLSKIADYRIIDVKQ